MITINLSRKEAYAFGTIAGITPLLLLIACLLGVGYLQSQNFEHFQSIDKQAIPKTAIIESSEEVKIKLATDDVIDLSVIPELTELTVGNSNTLENENVVSIATSLQEETPTILSGLTPEVTISVSDELATEMTIPAVERYSVQLASFTDLANAYSLIETLSTEILQPKVLIRHNSKTPYVVVFGQYNDQNEARNAAGHYNSTKNAGAFGVDLKDLGEVGTIASL